MTKAWKIYAVIAIAAALAIGGFSAWRIYRSNIWRGFDAQFGDQHLKTSVALVELHRVRYGRYPETLDDLKFTGEWDPIATGNVSYHVNTNRTRYCIEVERGWVGKPKIEMPAEFWQNTGYDPALCK
jgi:hypothetical protein